jgi:hypothetical protein
MPQVKPHHAQHEIYDTDHELFSHPLDALRYLLVNLPQPAADYRAPKIDSFMSQYLRRIG